MQGFAARHPWDRWFWIGFVLVAWIAVALGFGPQITRRFTGQADYEPHAALVIHVFAFFGWLTMLTLQVALAESGRIALHRLTGWAALVLAPVMAWSAIASEIFAQHYYPGGVSFFPIPVTSVTCFLTCTLAAILLRKRPAWHKRMIYMATSAVLVAAFFRAWGDPVYDALAPGPLTEWLANYSGVALMLLVAVVYDLATRGTVHTSLRIGVPAIIAAQVTAVLVGQSNWWQAFGSRLLGLP